MRSGPSGGGVGEQLRPGTKVEVRTGFDRSWAKGFEVVAWHDDVGGYQLRRMSDGSEVPGTFPPDAVRRARRPNDMWWF
jgi:hypothetical protein